MATNQARIKAILEAVKDAVITDNFIDKNAAAAVYNSTNEEIQDLLNDPLLTKDTLSVNQKRAMFLKKLEKSLKDAREKAAADKQAADDAQRIIDARNAANVE